MRNSQCSADDCNGASYCRGFCSAHYQKFMGNGTLQTTKRDAGTGTINNRGYISHAHKKGQKLEHRIVAEIALGKKIDPTIVVHHADGNKINNNRSNLVICPSQKYHALLHIRQDAHEDTGDANKRKCYICKKYDSIENLSSKRNGNSPVHLKCRYTRKTRSRAYNIKGLVFMSASEASNHFNVTNRTIYRWCAEWGTSKIDTPCFHKDRY